MSAFWKARRWFWREWWEYILAPRQHNGQVSWLATVWCRTRGHPHGVVWYNLGGTEPNMHCRDCGEFLG